MKIIYLNFVVVAFVIISCESNNKSGRTAPDEEDIQSDIDSSLRDSIVTEDFIHVNQQDSLALISFYNNTNGKHWTTKWDLKKPVNEWTGVDLDSSGNVTGLNLKNNNLQGNVTRPLQSLEHLRSLNLERNRINGTIVIKDDLNATKYTFSSHNHEDGNPLTDKTCFVIHRDGITLYSSAKADSIVYQIPPNERLECLTVFTRDSPKNKINIQGFKGRYIPVEYDGDTLYAFSGFLSIYPSCQHPSDGCFDEYLSQISDVSIFRGQFVDGEVMAMGEYNEDTYKYYQNNLIVYLNSGMEWEHRGIILDADKVSSEEVFLIFSMMFPDVFDQFLEVKFPDSDVKIAEERGGQMFECTLRMDGRVIKSLSISIGDIDGCGDSWQIYNEMNQIRITGGGGC